MAEYQQNFSKLLSVSSEDRDSVGSSIADPDGGDEEFYEDIEAPKFVDFTVPDHYRPDDHYWFCLRVGCDRKHEEEMDSEEIYKNFILRVMAARSPNVRFRKALERRNASRTPIKCPHSAPPKSSKPRTSKIAIISSFSKPEKMLDEKKRVVRPLLKPKPTPVTKTKPVAAKYLTTPRNNKCSQNQSSFRSVQHPKANKNEEPKSRVVSKALVFRSPKKAVKVKTSVELRTPISRLCEGMNKLEISSQRKKRVFGYSSTSVKNSGITNSRRELSSSKVQQRAKESVCPKSGRSIKSKVKGTLSQQVDPKKLLASEKVAKQSELQEQHSNSALTSPDEEHSNSESRANNRQDDDSNNRNGNSIERSTSERCEESLVQLHVNDPFEGERIGQEFMEGDDKENAAASDVNRMPIKDVKPNGRKIFGMHEKSSLVKKEKNLKESSISSAPVTKLKKPKPTHPKPFRLRTDERGILKEANLEKKTDPQVPRTERANSSALEGQLQRKQGNDVKKGSVIEGIKTPRVKERSKAAASVTPPPQRPKSSAIQRLERFRKISSPLLKQSLKPKEEVISATKEITSFLTPGKKLDVIPEASPEISEQGSTARKATPIASEQPDFHSSSRVPRSCTN